MMVEEKKMCRVQVEDHFKDVVVLLCHLFFLRNRILDRLTYSSFFGSISLDYAKLLYPSNWIFSRNRVILSFIQTKLECLLLHLTPWL